MKTTRRLTQLAFLLLTVVAVFVVQGDAERWCPFGGVEAAYSYFTAGTMTCSLGVSNFFILGGVLLMTLLLRRAFCSYACPIGTISEWLAVGAGKVGIRPWRVPYRLDRAMAMLKYAVLVFIIYITWQSSELLFRAFDPCYALISRHGKDITFWAYVVSGAIVVASLLVMLPFCRWLCPLAAVFTPFSRIGVARVRRHPETCVDCGRCTLVCPMGIRVDREKEVTASRCTSCLDCVSACPKPAAGSLSWGPPKFLGGRWSQGVLLVVLFACVGAAVAATYAFPFPAFVQEDGTPPPQTAIVDMRIDGATCRGSSNDLLLMLRREDEFAIPGYLKIEAWPAAEAARVRITYDPDKTDEAAIKRALSEPILDVESFEFLHSPFTVKGYNVLNAED